MLSFKSTNSFKSQYDILDDDVKIGTIVKKHWKNIFVIELPEKTLFLKSEKWYSSNRIVMAGDTEIARVEKKLFSFKPRILVHYKQRTFVLRPTNIMQTNFGLSLGEDGDYIGTISRSGFFTNVYEADLPASIEKWFQCVLVSLIIEYKLTQAAAS